MADTRPLSMTCDRCKVADKCPSRGQSPLRVGRQLVTCRIIGGYGRKPVDPDILSSRSAAMSAVNGPCLTIVEVPFLIEGTSVVSYRVEKVFSEPVLHEREKSNELLDRLYPKSHS